MQWDLTVNGQRYRIAIERRDGRWLCRINHEPVDADVVEIGPGNYSVLLGGRCFDAHVDPSTPETLQVIVGSTRVEVVFEGTRRSGRQGAAAAGRQPVTAPMPGKVVRVLVEPGTTVETGQGLVVLEAMKMQNELRAPRPGRVEQVLVRPGQAVNAGEVLVVVS
jgi:biotin carboxyl carrier protein